MKIIHSYWSKPSIEKGYDRSAGGWSDKKYNYMSWALSCLQFKKYYSEVELITDKLGKELLIDKLELPYTSVKVELDQLNDYHSDLWALGKIYAYSIQDKPFMHADGDLFIWKKFDSDLESASLFAQNQELNFPYHFDSVKEMEDNLPYIPVCIQEERAINKDDIYGCNAGIFGGNNISFFKEYTKEAFAFVDKNINDIHKINIGRFNITYEQFLFLCLAKYKNIKIHYFTEGVDHHFKGMTNFNRVPKKTTFIHPVGYYKKYKPIGEHIAMRLLADYPSYFYKIEKLIRNFQL